MSIITDTFFGGSEKKAAKAQQKGIEKGIQATQKATAQARQDVGELFPQARQDLLGGFQGAADVFSQFVPQQSDVFQQGNIGAQQAVLAGLPQGINAILGGNIDLSGLQPSQQIQPNFDFLNQQIADPAPAAPIMGPEQNLGLNPETFGGLQRLFGSGSQNPLGGLPFGRFGNIR